MGLTVDVVEWLNIYHRLKDSAPPKLSDSLQLPTLKNLYHIGASGSLPDLLTVEPLKTCGPSDP